MRHAHKKVTDTTNLVKSSSKYIYFFDDIKFYGICKIQEYLNTTLGYTIS